MTSRDKEKLAIVALAGVVVWCWWGALPKGVGWPSLELSDGKDRGGPDKALPSPKGAKPAPSSGRGRTPGTGGGDGVIDVTSPRVVSMEEYKKTRAKAAARAAKKRPKTP